jgi:ABC-2 type transport system permease protein
MNKIWLIIKREYLAKVRKRTFILSTVLFPVLYFALIFGAGYLSDKTKKVVKIAVIDSSGLFTKEKIDAANKIDSSNLLELSTASVDILKNNLSTSSYDGYMVVPADAKWQNGFRNLPLYSNRTLAVESSIRIQSKLNTAWDNIKNEKLQIDTAMLSIIKESKVDIQPINIKDEKANSGHSTLIGVIAAMLIYIMLMLYGSQVMMGVTEEKTSRIAEVVISSVKPFQLMLGKIIGIGMVAFTQIIIWVSVILIAYSITGGQKTNAVDGAIAQVQQIFTTVNVPQVLFFLVFYLMAGFFFYASLFAAAGSAVNEDMREAQSLSFPLMMPIIFSMVMMGSVLKDPSGPIAVWGSIIPFTSPIIMMVRIPFGVPSTVPWWQIGLSMATLVGGFFLTTWFAARIYRTGILMYGKKPSWKELIKWAFRK